MTKKEKLLKQYFKENDILTEAEKSIITSFFDWAYEKLTFKSKIKCPLSSKEVLDYFADTYKLKYNMTYFVIDGAIESSVLKRIINSFVKDGYKPEEVYKFIAWSIEKGVTHIRFLSYKYKSYKQLHPKEIDWAEIEKSER